MNLESTAAISVEKVSVTFGQMRALNEVSFDVQRGKVTALLGMNGSGKSTLIKVLAGLYPSDPGSQLRIGGEDVQLPMSPRRAHRYNLRFLHQDVGLVGALTIADNFGLVDSFPVWRLSGAVRAKELKARTARVLQALDINVHPDTLVNDLDMATRTMVAIARMMQSDTTTDPSQFVIVLDEPTATLPMHEVERVLALVQRIRSQGGTVIYVSHRTDEIETISDQLVILRDGKLIEDRPTAGLKSREIVKLIIGSELAKASSRPKASLDDAETILSAKRISGQRIVDVDFDLKRGEVIGIAGLVGCGRSELIRILAGAQKPKDGSLSLKGSATRLNTPTDAVRAGISYVPQDRHGAGVVLDMTIGENITLGRLFRYCRGPVISGTQERNSVDALIAKYRVKTQSPDTKIKQLSGGNQQKVVVARAASSGPDVLLLDEPTQGVDAHAKHEIYEAIGELAASGMGVIVGSTDNEELVRMCDRVFVFNRGSHVSTLTAPDFSEIDLTNACTAA